MDLQVQQVLETSNKSHVQALLKLRQYKKNLKYAIWDYQVAFYYFACHCSQSCPSFARYPCLELNKLHFYITYNLHI